MSNRIRTGMLALPKIRNLLDDVFWIAKMTQDWPRNWDSKKSYFWVQLVPNCTVQVWRQIHWKVCEKKCIQDFKKAHQNCPCEVIYISNQFLFGDITAMTVSTCSLGKLSLWMSMRVVRMWGHRFGDSSGIGRIEETSKHRRNIRRYWDPWRPNWSEQYRHIYKL